MTRPTIRQLRVRYRSLSPMAAEVWVSAGAGTATGLRGRVMGPQCRYAATVEVAYPLRPLPPAAVAALGPTSRVQIPEPSFWDVDSPHLYRGPVEFVEGDATLERTTVRFGLRSVRLAPRGLLWNGRLLELHGAPLPQPADEAAFLALRERGVNLVVVPAGLGVESAFDLADDVGLLVLYRLTDDPAARDMALRFDQHPSALGCLVPQALAETLLPGELAAAWRGTGMPLVLGLELDESPARPPPSVFEFVAGRPAVLAGADGTALPQLTFGSESAGGLGIGTVAAE